MIDDKKYNKCFIFNTMVIACIMIEESYYFEQYSELLKLFQIKSTVQALVSSECRGYIDVGDECWRRFILMTILR